MCWIHTASSITADEPLNAKHASESEQQQLLPQSTLSAANATTTLTSTTTSRTGNIRTIFTYFERLPKADRFTGMSNADDDALLETWKAAWRHAGWEPVVVSEKDAARHVDSARFETLLASLELDPFGEALFRRWLAMSQVGGGWLVDYDVFPLVGVETFPRDEQQQNDTDNTLTLYQTIAPTMASGSAEAWRRTVFDMLDQQQQQVAAVAADDSTTTRRYNYWTDTLGLLQLLADNDDSNYTTTTYPIHLKRRVLTADKVLPVQFLGYQSTSTSPLNNVIRIDCQGKQFQKNWVIHFGPAALQLAATGQLLPRNRAKVAEQWFSQWQTECMGSNTIQ